MEIILIKDVANLGLAGQTMEVAAGYARNFLLPTEVALLATPSNLKMLAKKRAEYEARAKDEKDRALLLRDKIAELKLIFRRKTGEKGKLYGAVTAMDIAESLENNGVDIERKRLRLSEPIKMLGDFEVPIRIHPEVLGLLKIAVLPEDEKAEVAPSPTPATEAPATA